jgi:hypothetical protein
VPALNTIAEDSTTSSDSIGASRVPEHLQDQNSSGTELAATWHTSVTVDVPLDALEPSLRLLQSAAWGLLRYMLCATLHHASTPPPATATALSSALVGSTVQQANGSASLQRDLFDVLLLELRLGAVCMEKLHARNSDSDGEVSVA